MLSFFWIIVILFVILVIAQLTVFLCVRNHILAHPKLKIRKYHIAYVFLLALTNLALASVSIGFPPTGADSFLIQSLSVSYFFYLGVCLALFLFFVVLGCFGLFLASIESVFKAARLILFTRGQKLAPLESANCGIEELNRAETQFGERSGATMSRRAFIRYTASGGAFAITGLGSYGLLEAYESPKVNVIEFSSPALSGLLKPVDIIQVTDLHFGMFYYASELEELVEKLNALEGAAVVVTGDIFHSPRTPVESAAPLLSKLRERPWGNLAILGNHDFYAGVGRSVKAIRDGGLRLLRNEWITFNEGSATIHMGGIDDPKVNWLTGKRFPDFEKFIGKKPKTSGFEILLSHRPVVFPLAAKENIHLTLAGHTHGGQITFPVPGSPRPLSLAGLVSPYTLGLYKSGSCRMYLNRGVGLTFIPARINCPPEIAVIRLTPGERNPTET